MNEEFFSVDIIVLLWFSMLMYHLGDAVQRCILTPFTSSTLFLLFTVV
jgi:hypothetical protein